MAETNKKSSASRNREEPTAKKVSIEDVARLAGVSTGTVSHALNSVGYVKESTREKVLAAARELGYVPNRAGRILKTAKTNLIMMAVPDASNEIYFGMIESVLRLVKQRGYSMLLYYTNGSHEEELHALRLLQECVVDGLFLVHFSYEQELLDEILRTNAPIVLCSMCNHLWAKQGHPFGTLSIDVYQGIYDAVTHLAKMGHRKIGYLAGRQDVEVYQQRYSAYQDALKACGLPFREDYVQWNDYSDRGGYHSTRALFELKDRPTAICASNDHQVIGAWEAIRDMGGRIPRDMALTGLDNLKISQMLGITSMDMHESEIGEAGAKMLLENLRNGTSEYRDLYFRPKMAVRESSLMNLSD